ncbi:glutaredoxin domain-containing protein [Yeosuana marina]|mgnify:CR=1 FL=1|uniref:glutaredoxin domain-containing protein n=1 Tax=Yeosuana marina TaxID=1565536 RepID=UPI0030EF6F8F|tara:strand:+ start:1589 stop:2224 length:636 start_codon:yes stop_codon:yes gene_type:complete
MFKFLIYIISFFIIQIAWSQNNNHPYVKLIEKKNGKRLELFAKNSDTVSYSIFLRVTTDDFRRSSNRPVLETIYPKSEKHLLTLIKLANKEGLYEYQFIVNKYTEELSFTKDHDGVEINFNDALKSKSVVVFETDDCDICDQAKRILTNNDISFKTYNFSNNPSEIFNLLKIQKDTINKTFILKIQDSIYDNIETKDTLIETFKKYFPEIN